MTKRKVNSSGAWRPGFAAHSCAHSLGMEQARSFLGTFALLHGKDMNRGLGGVQGWAFEPQCAH